MTDTGAEQERRAIIRLWISGELTPDDAAAALGISTPELDILRQRFGTPGDERHLDHCPAGEFERRLSQVGLPHPGGPSPALTTALEEIARMTPALAAQAEMNIAVHELRAANSNTGASRQVHVEPSMGNVRPTGADDQVDLT